MNSREVLQSFIDDLYKAGWDSPCDAQHSKIEEVFNTYFSFSHSSKKGKELFIKLIQKRGAGYKDDIPLYDFIMQEFFNELA